MKGNSSRGRVLTSVVAASLLVFAVPTPTATAGHLHTCFGKRVTLRGDFGPNVINGTDKRDVIVAGGGADIVFGNGGNDLICGNRGDDTLVGGEGFDKVNGGKGADSCEAERKRKC